MVRNDTDHRCPAIGCDAGSVLHIPESGAPYWVSCVTCNGTGLKPVRNAR